MKYQAEKTVIRVGEKNNFNMTTPELKELKKYEAKGKIFVNSNSFNPVDSTYPSFITINPYMTFNAITGDMSNIKAVRIKIFRSSFQEYRMEIVKCIQFCMDNDLPILLTYMRYRKKITAEKFTGTDYKKWYVFDKGYYRPRANSKSFMREYVASMLEIEGKGSLLHECDSSGNGCPECNNCAYLSYGYKTDTIRALNLSESGINDRYGKKGLCPYNCPDCFAKIVTMGKRPQCDKLITNRKISGKLKHT